jgi:hypothetical protein
MEIVSKLEFLFFDFSVFCAKIKNGKHIINVVIFFIFLF